MSQAKGLSAAVEGIARNPSAAGEIRGNLILGLVLIESLVIYVLLISLILFFVEAVLKPTGQVGMAGAVSCLSPLQPVLPPVRSVRRFPASSPLAVPPKKI